MRRDNESLTKLVAEKAATPEELEQNRLQLTQAEADVHSAEKVKQTLEQQAQLDQGRVALLVDHARATYAISRKGWLGSRHRSLRRDAVFSADSSGRFREGRRPAGEMADLHHVRVRAFIDEPELGQIELNQPVEILWDAHPDRVWNGRTEVLPKQVVTRGTRNVGELICSVTNDRLDLLPNTTVDVRIQISERPEVLVVPRGAVYIEGDKRYVFRVVDNRLHRVAIKVGIANPTKIEVLSGLNEGDVVALPGEVSLKENLRDRPGAAGMKRRSLLAAAAAILAWRMERSGGPGGTDRVGRRAARLQRGPLQPRGGRIEQRNCKISQRCSSLHFLLGESYYQLRELHARCVEL